MIDNRRSCCSIPPPDGRISPQDSCLCRTINAKRTRREGNDKKKGKRKNTIEKKEHGQKEKLRQKHSDHALRRLNYTTESAHNSPMRVQKLVTWWRRNSFAASDQLEDCDQQTASLDSSANGFESQHPRVAHRGKPFSPANLDVQNEQLAFKQLRASLVSIALSKPKICRLRKRERENGRKPRRLSLPPQQRSFISEKSRVFGYM